MRSPLGFICMVLAQSISLGGLFYAGTLFQAHPQASLLAGVWFAIWTALLSL